MRRDILFTCMVASAMATLATSARAELVYDGDSLTDTATGLIWTHGQLPTATFIPAAGNTVATFGQFVLLATSLGIGPSPTQAAPYVPFSPKIAAFADWYGGWAWLYGGPEPGDVCNGPNGGGNCFVGTGLVYEPGDYPFWTSYVVQTISRYGPTFTLPPGGWEQDFEPTLFVRPVPLPAGVWLALSGFALLTRLRRKTRVG